MVIKSKTGILQIYWFTIKKGASFMKHLYDKYLF